MSKTPERFLWAADMLDIEPHHRILEIGCGAGLLAEKINSRLSNGKFTGIDKSPPMLEKARKRNQEYIEAGKALFVVADFKSLNLPNFNYDTIVAFNVNFFWKDGTVELAKIKSALKQTGKLLVFYQAPFEISIHAAEPIRQNLAKNSFTILDTIINHFTPTSAICIVAKPQFENKQNTEIT